MTLIIKNKLFLFAQLIPKLRANLLLFMKKPVFIFGLLLSLLSFVYANAQVKFEKNTWQETLDKAKQQNKPIFLDIYASWCGPCKELDQKVYPDDKVAALMNEKFINFKADGEEGEGIELQKQFNISSYPTLIFIKPNGDKFYSYEGYRDPEEFIQEAEYALSIVSKPTVSDYAKSFEKGERSKAFLQEYLNALYRDDYEHLFNEKVLEAYIKTLAVTELAQKEVAETIWQQLPSVQRNSFSHEFIKKNLSILYTNGVEVDAEERLSTTDLSAAVESYFAYYDVKRAINKNDETSVLNALSQFKSVCKQGTAWFSEPETTTLSLKKEFYELNDNKEKVLDVLEEEVAYVYTQLKIEESREAYVDSTADATPNWAEILNNAAWYYYENTSNLDKLFKAVEWSKKSIEIEAYAAYYDTYAHLLFELDNYEDALIAERKAIELAYEYGEDAAGYWRSLIEMKTEIKQGLELIPIKPTEESLKKDLDHYLKLTKEVRIDEMLDFVPDALFDIVPQETFCDMFYKVFHNEEMPISIVGIQNLKFYKIIPYENAHYSMVKYGTFIRMDISQLLENEGDEKKYLDAFKLQFGNDNVTFDKTSKALNVYQENKMFAIATQGGDSWKFINNEANMKGIIEQIVPKKVQNEFD